MKEFKKLSFVHFMKERPVFVRISAIGLSQIDFKMLASLKPNVLQDLLKKALRDAFTKDFDAMYNIDSEYLNDIIEHMANIEKTKQRLSEFSQTQQEVVSHTKEIKTDKTTENKFVVNKNNTL